MDVQTVAADTPEEIKQDIDAVAQIEGLSTILEVLCELTGMRFAAVARVTDHTWTACAVHDKLNFGLGVGGQLPVDTTLCRESRRLNAPIAFGHASTDPKYREHHTTRIYQLESYISVPIVLATGRYFGNLCAIDPAPAEVENPRVLKIFERFASLVAVALENHERRQRDSETLTSERATSQLREQFIAILGHDLRNPLQAVLAGSEVLQRKPTDAGLVKELAKRISLNAKRMSALINDVLDFARGKMGDGIRLKLDEVDDINAGLLQVVKELQDGQPEREILTNISVTRKVRCDLGRIQQVASNLIGNALTHGTASTPVRVNAHADSDTLILSVWNGGEPIPPQSMSNIFEPFWRSSTSASREGLGLGLHICSQIIRAHDGKLTVTSSAAGGTEFTARLPLQ